LWQVIYITFFGGSLSLALNKIESPSKSLGKEAQYLKIVDVIRATADITFSRYIFRKNPLEINKCKR